MLTYQKISVTVSYTYLSCDFMPRQIYETCHCLWRPIKWTDIKLQYELSTLDLLSCNWPPLEHLWPYFNPVEWVWASVSRVCCLSQCVLCGDKPFWGIQVFLLYEEGAYHLTNSFSFCLICTFFLMQLLLFDTHRVCSICNAVRYIFGGLHFLNLTQSLIRRLQKIESINVFCMVEWLILSTTTNKYPHNHGQCPALA